MKWPDNKSFAFTVFDDTDFSTVENTRPVYDFLAECGLRTTKSVWPVKGERKPFIGGATCEEPDYLGWVETLQTEGFEIGYHLATYHTSRREETAAGLERFRALFGTYPRSMANHVGCREGIYNGSARLTGFNRGIYNAATFFRNHQRFRGHLKGDPLFWGDHCKNRIAYVRNFVIPEINTLSVCPFMPYHDPSRPWVNHWFASSEGANAASFVRCIDEASQDRLEADGGACIMYTHFSCGFYKNGALSKRFKYLMKRLSQKEGWFVTTSTLLDHLRSVQGHHVISDNERRRLERRWLRTKLLHGTS